MSAPLERTLHGGLQRSDSLISSLCREVEAIRSRSLQIHHGIAHCQDRSLLQRLEQEWGQLQARRRELLQVARSWRRRGVADALALEFLMEIASRQPAA